MSYVGNAISIPIGKLGLVSDRAPKDSPLGSLIEVQNMQLDGTVLFKSPGSKKLTTSALDGSITGLYDWFPSPVIQRLIAVTNAGSIYKDSGDGSFNSQTAINTGLSEMNNQSVFVEGGVEVTGNAKKLFLFTDSNQVQVLSGDGTAFTEMSLPALDWTSGNFPTSGIAHQGRVWAMSGHNIYASNPDDHEDFQDASLLVFNVFPGEGEALTAFQVYNGRLFFFKDPQGAYFLDDSDTSTANWTIRKLKGSFGAPSARSVVGVLNDVLLKNETGSVTSLTATQKFGDMESADLLRQLKAEKFMRNNTSRSGNPRSHVIYYPDKKQVLMTYQPKVSSEKTRLMVIDFAEEQARIVWEQKDDIEVLALRKTIEGIQKPIYGDSAGDVFLMDQVNRDVAGVAYEGFAKTPDLDFGFADPSLAGKNKLFEFLEIVYSPTGKWDLSVEVFIDGHLSETLTFPQAQGNVLTETAVATSFLLDGLTHPNHLADANEPEFQRKRLHGSGRRLSLKFKNAGLGQNFIIHDVIVSFRVSDEKARRR